MFHIVARNLLFTWHSQYQASFLSIIIKIQIKIFPFMHSIEKGKGKKPLINYSRQPRSTPRETVPHLPEAKVLLSSHRTALPAQCRPLYIPWHSCCIQKHSFEFWGAFLKKFLFCCSGWLWNCGYPPASASKVLGLCARSNISDSRTVPLHQSVYTEYCLQPFNVWRVINSLSDVKHFINW